MLAYWAGLSRHINPPFSLFLFSELIVDGSRVVRVGVGLKNLAFFLISIDCF